MNSAGFDNQMRLWDMVVNAGPMVKFVLLLLLAFSILSWAIIIYKLLLLRKVEKETAAFSHLFWGNRQFAQIFAASKNYKHSPLAALFSSVYAEFANSAKTAQREDVGRFQRMLRKTATLEGAKLEYAVPFLATTGNTAPFIGLFGTVWGIMTAFRGIGAKGAANLAVVAPGISEALIATAMGLLVAIPASVAYNHILARIDRAHSEMDNFSADLLNIIEKQIAKNSSSPRVEPFQAE